MPPWLPILIFIFAAILIIDAIGSFALSRLLKNKLFFKASLAWTANFINFIIHGSTKEHGTMTLIGHACYFVTACFLTSILCDVTEQKINFKNCLMAGVAMLTLSLISFWCFHSYMLSALILDLFIAIPMLFFSCFAIKNKSNDFISKTFAVLLIVNSIHFLDYPFLYNNPAGNIFGFSLAFLISILFSIILPSLILQMRTKKYTQELENTVKIRTSELEELNKDNTTIISMVCHDISTPIMLAHGHLNQIFKKGLKQEQDLLKGLNKIDVNLSLVSDILKKVKHMQSVKLGKIEPVIEKCDVEPLIHETIEIFSLNFLEKKIIPKVFIRENSIIEAFIDPTLFKSQIMGNLISNAIKFSNTGEQIEFSVINNERFVEVSIRNYGAGISSDKIHNIFNINKNTSTKGTNAEAGTGLGLPTVKIITERMGGSVSVMAEDIIENDKIIKSATTFTVTLKSAV